MARALLLQRHQVVDQVQAVARAMIDLVGEEVLMYASDYPHGESHFPKSVEKVLAWDMPQARKRKLFWDNAVRLYARCGLQ